MLIWLMYMQVGECTTYSPNNANFVEHGFFKPQNPRNAGILCSQNWTKLGVNNKNQISPS